jgi:hypothetical protein
MYGRACAASVVAALPISGQGNTIMKTVSLAAALAVAFVAPAAAAEHAKVGQLRCEVSGGLGMIITSTKEMECRFLSANGHEEWYHGRIRKFGLDIGGTDRGMLVWDVFAPTAGSLRGALAGEYVGVGASATVVVGLGANALLGGSDRQISLQPLSIQSQTGLDIAAGVSSLTLRRGA